MNGLKRHEIEVICQLLGGMSDDNALVESVLLDPKNHLDVKPAVVLSNNKHKGALDAPIEGEGGGDDRYNKERTPASYEAEIELLRELLDRARESKRGAKGKKPEFWKESPYISEDERTIFRKLCTEKIKLAELAQIMGVTERRLYRMMEAAIARHTEGIQENLLRWLDNKFLRDD
jgi:hypothetical protein